MFEPKVKAFDKDSLQTPEYLYNWLDSMYAFDADLAANDGHHFNEIYFTKDHSAFDVSWSDLGSTGFCNPPYSDIDPWVERAIEEASDGFTTVMLIPDVNGEERFEAIMREATLIIHIVGRVNFIRPDNGLEYKGNNRGSCIVEFSPKYYPRPATHTSVNRDWIKEQARGLVSE